MLNLYCFGESGNAYKAALALELTGLEWQAIPVDFFSGEARSDAYKRDINAMGEVPVLFDTEAQYQISQSGAILDYIADLSGQLGGTTARDQREILRWILWDNHKLSSQAGTVRFLTNFLPEEKRPLEAISYMKNRLKSAYKVLNAHLENRDWMVGSALSNADISCCGYLFYPEPFGFQRADWPHIDAWLTRIETTPGWQHPYDLMPAPTVGTNIRSPK